jgi:hypothetical protein
VGQVQLALCARVCALSSQNPSDSAGVAPEMDLVFEPTGLPKMWIALTTLSRSSHAQRRTMPSRSKDRRDVRKESTVTTRPETTNSKRGTRRIGAVAGSLTAALCGFGILGTGTAFAQSAHHRQGAVKLKISGRERLESAVVKEHEGTSGDPNSNDPNDSADRSSTDASANDEGPTDTPSSDATDSGDQASTDSSLVTKAVGRHG